MEDIYNFSLEGDDSNTHTLSEYKGKKLILYFYPKDNTPGWIKEAVEFNLLKDQLNELNCVVVGVSKDSVASHLKFKEKQNFDHLLLVDNDLELMRKLEVYGEKNMYGKKTMGVKRTTLLLDEDGNLLKRWNNVRAGGHAQRVLDYIKSI